MIKVQVRPNEPLEAALRRFKRQCNYAGIFRLAKKYSFHEKSSDKNRREDRERIRNIKRASKKAGGGGGRGGSRRRTKMRTSSVTPESARRAAEEAEAAKVASVAETEATPVVDTGVDTAPVSDGTTLRIGNAQAVVGTETKTDDGGEG